MSADNWTKCPKCPNLGLLSFREDYEIGIWNGTFNISYSGKCVDCGFEHRFTHSENLTDTINKKKKGGCL